MKFRLVTPWKLFFESRDLTRELKALPGYTDIWERQKALVPVFYAYILGGGFLFLVVMEILSRLRNS